MPEDRWVYMWASDDPLIEKIKTTLGKLAVSFIIWGMVLFFSFLFGAIIAAIVQHVTLKQITDHILPIALVMPFILGFCIVIGFVFQGFLKWQWQYWRYNRDEWDGT